MPCTCEKRTTKKAEPERPGIENEAEAMAALERYERMRPELPPSAAEAATDNERIDLQLDGLHRANAFHLQRPEYIEARDALTAKRPVYDPAMRRAALLDLLDGSECMQPYLSAARLRLMRLRELQQAGALDEDRYEEMRTLIERASRLDNALLDLTRLRGELVRLVPPAFEARRADLAKALRGLDVLSRELSERTAAPVHKVAAELRGQLDAIEHAALTSHWSELESYTR